MKKQITLLVLFALMLTGCRFNIDWVEPPPIVTAIPDFPASATPNIILPPTFTPIVVAPPDTPTPEPAPTHTPSVDFPDLTEAQLKNGRFDLMDANGKLRSVQFEGGSFQQGSDRASPDYAAFTMTSLAFGDLNGDGAGDAAAIVVENYGGTGQFVSVAAFLNRNGQPVYAASHFVDDRALVTAFAIYNREIYLDATIHGFEDPGCCPNFPTRRTLRLWEGQLALASFSSQTPTNAERAITIDAPVNGTEVGQVFSLSGGISIAPFENNLVYEIYIPEMSDPFTIGSLMVSAPDFGAPGTFTLPLNFSAAGYSGPVRIVISDLSAADGSLLAMDALFVTVK